MKIVQILAGDFGDNKIAVLNKSLTGNLESMSIPTSFLGTPHTVSSSKIANIEVVTDENKISVLGACGWAAAGTLIAGPIGAIVGGILGGRSHSYTLLVTLLDNKRFLATCSTDEYKTLLAATIRSTAIDSTKVESVEKLDWTCVGGPDCTEKNDWSFLNDLDQSKSSNDG